MRSYLTRLTFSAAGVVLTGLGMAAAAHAGESGPTLERTPTHIEETAPVGPEVNKCDIEFTVQDCVLPADEDPKPVFTFDPELVDPGLWDDDDTPDPGDDTSDEPEDAGPEKPEDGEGEGEPVDQPADDGKSGGRGEPAGAGSGDTSSDASDDKASDGKASEDVADEPTPEPDETAVTPAAHVTAADEGRNRNPVVGVLAIALGMLGIALVGLGLSRRPQPTLERRTRRGVLSGSSVGAR